MESDAEKRKAEARLRDLSLQIAEARASLARYGPADAMYAGLQRNLRGLEQLVRDHCKTTGLPQPPEVSARSRSIRKDPTEARRQLDVLLEEVGRVRRNIESEGSERGLVAEVMRSQLNILLTRVRQHCREYGLVAPDEGTLLPTKRG